VSRLGMQNAQDGPCPILGTQSLSHLVHSVTILLNWT